MTRGLRKHLKRLNAPKNWMLDKLGGTWAPRPSPGPHKLRECLPLTLVLRQKLKYALNRREVMMIVMRRSIQVDGKVRTDICYPTGFQDVITIEKTNERFRLLFDVKGRFTLHRISAEEAKYKLLRVLRVVRASKSSQGRNPFLQGQAATIPYVVTHDGRTIRYPDPLVKANDTIKFDLASGKILDFVKFEVGNLCMVTRGANQGRVGIMVHNEKHPGSFDIVHLKDRRGNEFATRGNNVFIIGDGNKPLISLPRGKGVRLTILEQRDQKEQKKGKKD